MRSLVITTIDGEDSMQPFDDTDVDVPTEISNVCIYIPGYLIQKLQKSEGFDYQSRLSPLIICNSSVVEDSQTYLHLRAYTYRKDAFGGLTAPSAGLVQVLKQVGNLFRKSIQEMQKWQCGVRPCSINDTDSISDPRRCCEEFGVRLRGVENLLQIQV